MAEPAILIEASGLRVGFAANGRLPERVLIRQLDWTLRAGERIGFTGPSGLGKTTLISAILHRAVGRPVGTILSGRLAVAPGPIGYVSQRPDTLPWFRVGRLLDSFRERAEESRRAVLLELTARFGLDRLKDAHPATLSGGELQRLKLMTALSLAGNLLVLDEPLSALDIPTRIALLGEVSCYLDAHDVAMVLVSHDVDVLLRLSHTVNVLDSAGIANSLPGALPVRRAQAGGASACEAWVSLLDRNNLIRAIFQESV